MEDNSLYRDIFFEETDTYLEQLNDDVLSLEENPENLEIINSIFRSAHTLKGMAATMGYETMTDLTHHMETVFVLLKDEEIKATRDVVTLIFECLDTLSDIVEDLRADGSGEMDVSDLIDRLDHVSTESDTEGTVESEETEVDEEKLVPHLETWDSSDLIVIEEGNRQGFNAFVIAVRIEKESFMKSARAYMVVNNFEAQGELILSEPNVDELEEGEFETDFNILYLTKESKETIEESVLGISEIEAVVIEDAEKVLIEASEKEEAEAEEAKAKTKDETDDKATTKKERTRTTRPPRQTIRVDINRLDQFMNLVSELVIHRTRLEDISTENQVQAVMDPLEQVARITSDLQDLVLQLRMQPFQVAVQRFPRMIRDIADELDKDIRLVVEGEDTELDRTVVAELGEPLVHLLRNAADHGIEMPEERVAAGKDPQGEIRISAYPEGNRVVLTISDDGKGLNPEAIKKSAESKGFDTEGLSDTEINQLIFAAGFSTNENVTDVSGRGVGMDVVRQKISQLNGTIELISELGKGTTFRITLPLTLSIIQSLLIKTGGEIFALPQSVIETIEPLETNLAATIHQSQVYSYNGKYIPLVSLNDRLGLESQAESRPHVVIVMVREQYYAIIVDDLVEQREIVIKDLGPELRNKQEYLGASILGNGDVILIIDLSTICEVESGHIK